MKFAQGALCFSKLCAVLLVKLRFVRWVVQHNIHSGTDGTSIAVALRL